MCLLVVIKDRNENFIDELKKLQKSYNPSSTQIVLVEGLCYLEEL